MPGEIPVVRVELFGVARHRAGVASAELPAGSVRQLLGELQRRFPRLDLLTPQGALAPHFLLSLGGERFLGDLEAILLPEDTLLILGADAGG